MNLQKTSIRGLTSFKRTFDNSGTALKTRIGGMGKAICLSLITLIFVFNAGAQYVNFEWAKSLGSSGNDEAKAIALDSKGNVYVTGSFEEFMVVDLETHQDTLTAAGIDVFLAKYNSSGHCIWVKRMGGADTDWGLAIVVDTADNVYVAGSFAGSTDFNPGGSGGTLTAVGLYDLFLAKYDSSGNYQWAQNVGSNVYISPLHNGLTVDRVTNNVYVVGSFAGTANFNPGGGAAALTAVGNLDAFIAKYAQSGDYIWAKNIGGSGAYLSAQAIALDATGNVHVTGELHGTADFNAGGVGGVLTAIGAGDAFLAKYDSGGTYLWAKNMGGGDGDYGNDLTVDASGNVYITGKYAASSASPPDFNPGGSGGNLINTGGAHNIFLAKYDSIGNFLWANAMGSDDWEAGFGVAVDRTNNVYITGYFRGSVDFDPDGSGDTLTVVGDNLSEVDNDVFVAKYDSSGNYVWAKSMGSRLRDIGYDIVVDSSDNVYLTGYFRWSANFNPNGLNGELDHVGGSDVFIAKLSQGCELYTTFIESSCDSFFFNNVTYNESGIYIDTFTSTHNCDSIVLLELTIGKTSEIPVVIGHYCDSATFNGVTYLNSGAYMQSYSNSAGCDSTIFYDLTIGKSNTSELTLTACDSLVLEEEVYTSSGTYTQVLTNASGCDSTLTIDLIVNSSPLASVLLNGSTLTANNEHTYQWVDCDNDYTPVAGATQQSFTPTETGNYAVIITTADGCSDTADCTFVEVGNSSINQLSPGNAVRVYPNPAQSQLNIQTQQVLNTATIRLVNILGQVLNVRENQQGRFFTVDMAPYTPGIYFLDINESGNAVRVKVVKE